MPSEFQIHAERRMEDPMKLQRLGQWYINKYVPLTTDPDLFYEVDDDKAMDIIRERYLKEH